MRWALTILCVAMTSGAVACRARTAGGKASDVEQVAGTAGAGDLTMHGCVVRDPTGAFDLVTRENPGGVGGEPGAGEHPSPPGTNPGQAGETHQYRLVPGQGIDLSRAVGHEVEIAGAPGAPGGQQGSAFEQQPTGTPSTSGGAQAAGSAAGASQAGTKQAPGGGADSQGATAGSNAAVGTGGNSHAVGTPRTAVTGQAGGASMGSKPLTTALQTFSVDRLRVLADNCAATGMPPAPPGGQRK